MEKIDNSSAPIEVERPPETEQGEFVGIFDDLTAIWRSSAWLDYIANRENGAN